MTSTRTEPGADAPQCPHEWRNAREIRWGTGGPECDETVSACRLCGAYREVRDELETHAPADAESCRWLQAARARDAAAAELSAATSAMVERLQELGEQ